MENTISLQTLQDEFKFIKPDILQEENVNCKNIYEKINNEYGNVKRKLPYPKVGPYDVGYDYDSRINIQLAKKINQPYWDRMAVLKEYFDCKNLYSGHVEYQGKNFFIMDNVRLATKNLSEKNVWLIAADDENWAHIVSKWNFPEDDSDVYLSDIITMKNKTVTNVDVKLDHRTNADTDITDAYLKNALLRNKNKSSIQSIIQTIQKKQDEIRKLPIDSALVLQGCAGSGKTMVLLHRIRYMLYNRKINSDNYVLIGPSRNYLDFTKDICKTFAISSNNVHSFISYYKSIAGYKDNGSVKDYNELIFCNEVSKDYLKTVYSEAFMRNVYDAFYKEIEEQADVLIGLCDDQLGVMAKHEEVVLKQQLASAVKDAYLRINYALKPIKKYIDIELESSLNNVDAVIVKIKALRDDYVQNQAKKNDLLKYEKDIIVSDDDERLTKNTELQHLKKMVDKEIKSILRSTVYTRKAHEKKLEKFQKEYKALKENLVKNIIEEEKAKLIELAKQCQGKYEDITIEEIDRADTEIKESVAWKNNIVAATSENLENFEEYFQKQHTTAIRFLNDFIDASSDFKENVQSVIKELRTSHKYLENFVLRGNRVLSTIIADYKKNEIVKKSTLKCFMDEDVKKVDEQNAKILFDLCKKFIKESFKVRISDKYKHYWYLNAYACYLTKQANKSYQYIFIDEAQDLSLSEIELIRKLNVTLLNRNTVLNLFGDVNQTISEHGIKTWNAVKMHGVEYTLSENFRNTNQIIDYCNNKLHMSMQKVGVDMEAVKEYQFVDSPVYNSDNVIFIVKDDYIVSDLKETLKAIDITGYTIYTVKEAKGLEFKEIYVLDGNMTANEKYIAYTRALAKLNVIKNLPPKQAKTVFVVEGEE